jgi:hypothetical protein
MGGSVGTFRTPEDALAYYERYDQSVAQRWPVPRSELDVTTSFGTTHVRRSGPSEGTPLVLLHPTSGSSIGWLD